MEVHARIPERATGRSGGVGDFTATDDDWSEQRAIAGGAEPLGDGDGVDDGRGDGEWCRLADGLG
jgi:hypothetical protein